MCFSWNKHNNVACNIYHNTRNVVVRPCNKGPSLRKWVLNGQFHLCTHFFYVVVVVVVNSFLFSLVGGGLWAQYCTHMSTLSQKKDLNLRISNCRVSLKFRLGEVRSLDLSGLKWSDLSDWMRKTKNEWLFLKQGLVTLKFKLLEVKFIVCFRLREVLFK